MEDNSYLPDCRDDDVLSFGSGTQPVMFRVSKFRKAVKNAFQDFRQLPDALCEFLKSQGVQIDTGGKWNHKTFFSNNFMWFGEGIDCEVLKLGAKDWQKGKVRIRVSLEFCPDEPAVAETAASNEPEIAQPESPLDDIRRMMNENS